MGKIYYTSLDTGKEYEVGVVSAVADTGACDTAASTSNGVVENMFEAIPNAVVPGLIVTGPTAATPTATGAACKYAITFTHNPGALHPIRVETHILSSDADGSSVGELEGSQWNDGWFTVGHITPLTTQVYVIEPVVDEDASASTVNVHLPIITAFTKKSVVG